MIGGKPSLIPFALAFKRNVLEIEIPGQRGTTRIRPWPVNWPTFAVTIVAEWTRCRSPERRPTFDLPRPVERVSGIRIAEELPPLVEQPHPQLQLLPRHQQHFGRHDLHLAGASSLLGGGSGLAGGIGVAAGF